MAKIAPKIKKDVVKWPNDKKNKILNCASVLLELIKREWRFSEVLNQGENV